MTRRWNQARLIGWISRRHAWNLAVTGIIITGDAVRWGRNHLPHR